MAGDAATTTSMGMPNGKLFTQGMADRGPQNRTGTVARHPVERLVLDHTRRTEQQEMMSKAVVHGLQSSLTGLETMMDMDDDIEFEDIFNLEVEAPVPRTMGPNFGMHEVMEARLGMR